MTEDPREKILAFGTAISEGAADIPGLDHWRSLPIAQAPSWADEADHRAAVAELSALPPLVFAGEVDLLRARLARLSNLTTLYKALGGGWTEQTQTGGRT